MTVTESSDESVGNATAGVTVTAEQRPGLRAIAAEAWMLYRRHWRRLLLVTAIFLAPAMVTRLLAQVAETSQARILATAVPVFDVIIGLTLTVLAELALVTLAQGFILTRPASNGDILIAMRQRSWDYARVWLALMLMLIVAGLVSFVAVLVGFIGEVLRGHIILSSTGDTLAIDSVGDALVIGMSMLFIVPYVRFCVASTVCLVERLGPVAALRRSWHLTGSHLRLCITATVFIFIVWFAAVTLPSIGISRTEAAWPVGLRPLNPPLALVVRDIGTIALYPFHVLVVVLLYRTVRARPAPDVHQPAVAVSGDDTTSTKAQ